MWGIYVFISVGYIQMRTGILELLGHNALHIFVFKWLLLFTFSSIVWWKSYLWESYLLHILMFLQLKKFGHFGRCVITLGWGLSCISLMLSEVGHFDHLEIFFSKYMFKPFACFFLGLCIFLNIYLTISLYLPYMRPSSDICYIFTSGSLSSLLGIDRRP